MSRRQLADWCEQEQIINRPYMTREDIAKLIPIAKSTINAECQEMENLFKDSNIRFYDTKPKCYPTQQVLNFFRIDEKTIRKQAKDQRKFQLEKRGDLWQKGD